MQNTPRQTTFMMDVLDIASALIEKPSITPEDAGCQIWLAEALQHLDFQCQTLPFGNVSNLWATHGQGHPLFVFAGHTDVVPAGDEKLWHTSPFQAKVKDGMLFGRGCADMKGALAAMFCACQDFIKQYPNHPGTIAFLLTSDEEGPAINGTAKVVRWLKAKNICPDYILIGEPSSHQQLGDTIKIGRRGSMSGHLRVFGKQGHVAYPHKAQNPLHMTLHIIHALTEKNWDHGNADFPPTSFQITNLNAGVGASNVIPGLLECEFNFRFSPLFTPEALQKIVVKHLEQLELPFELFWKVYGDPFLTQKGPLLVAAHRAIEKITGIQCKESTSGGTSDGRFLAATGAELIELGLTNETIHQVNEQVPVNDLYQLAKIYQDILHSLLQ